MVRHIDWHRQCTYDVTMCHTNFPCRITSLFDNSNIHSLAPIYSCNLRIFSLVHIFVRPPQITHATPTIAHENTHLSTDTYTPCIGFVLSIGTAVECTEMSSVVDLVAAVLRVVSLLENCFSNAAYYAPARE
eukprot:COSAG01_NODE_1811_length_9181_cov_14.633010_3_plen_132_part_00